MAAAMAATRTTRTSFRGRAAVGFKGFARSFCNCDPIMTGSHETERCRRMAYAIQQLDTTEMEELFKMLHRNGCQYTTNNNGVFINLSRLSEDLLDRIEKYIEFCNESRQNVKRYESLCQVLCAGNAAAHEAATPSRMARTPPTPSPPNLRYGGGATSGGAATAGGAGGGGSKVSSSMKFYLLKKKYAKVSTPTPACKDELAAEPM